MENHRSHGLAACCLLAGATALSLIGGCARGSAAPPPEQRLGEASQHLDGDQCIYFDINGKDTICHHTGSVSHPFTLIKISDQACINGHSTHADDYITSVDPASPLYDPTCNGQGCLPTAAPCDGTLDCCTGSCVSGTCVDPCSPNPCENGGTCAASGSSFTCTCTGGFTGTNCEIPPTPPEPAIGCHRNAAGDQSLNDLFYRGPIDTSNNVEGFRTTDGTCGGAPLPPDGSALISAANAADAAAKCQSLLGLDAFSDDASIWNGLAGFWICSPPMM
ncbi:MAG TPA: calcium-binding EGF-like domain-containing protein [Kofleriaceae bacterium]|nr:calcium-binding EGF-like domain-containing protein [Kofleriaceae bacterium]